MYFFNTKGEVRSIPAGCTNAAGVDPFVEISAGRSFFRTKDLMELAELLERVIGEFLNHAAVGVW